ncbi:uncharacterized protein LOC132269741 [Cornus florida]|uniref:uncharacterized protein LOC132269741 n=1 Tax=Cornus florida TaxID=4283 RepID=UPI0028A20C0E|nr:uncharacterized protein LOC132269741 [Cornus florida]
MSFIDDHMVVTSSHQQHSPHPVQAIRRENRPSLYHHQHHHHRRDIETRGRGGRPSLAPVYTMNSSNSLIPIHQLAPHQRHLFGDYLPEDDVLVLDDSSDYSLYSGSGPHIPATPNSDNFPDNMSYEVSTIPS